MTIQEILDKIAGNAIAPPSVAEVWLKRALNYSGENPDHVIFSYQAAPSGIAISSVFLIGARYIVEVRLSHKPSFDVVLKQGVRLELEWAHISFNDGVTGSSRIDGLKAELSHSPDMTTEMFYFGKDVDHWIDSVYAAFPATILHGT